MTLFKKFLCEHCEQKFRKQEELMNHLQITHYKDLPYDCKACNQNFSNMEDMRTHLQRFHSYKKDRD
jgi:KRAB domain-containing zinc finger protein|tara:strand:+ start:366 stop:566 length:201 start_codon:yes stop_codon:yes gene_type:complete